jgi:hypothetical protein
MNIGQWRFGRAAADGLERYSDVEILSNPERSTGPAPR